MKNRFRFGVSLFLCLCLCICLIPSSIAEENDSLSFIENEQFNSRESATVDEVLQRAYELDGYTDWRYNDGQYTYCLLFVSDFWSAYHEFPDGKVGLGFDGSYGWGSAQNYCNNFRISDSMDNIPIGADVFFSTSDGYGHIGIYVGDGAFLNAYAQNIRIDTFYDSPYGLGDYWANHFLGWGWHQYVDVIPPPPPEIHGSEMSFGYERVLPDGDYIIATAYDPLYFLDIVGEGEASNEDNVQLYHADDLDGIHAYDVWTITYNANDKFYTIRQKGTSLCLDVAGGYTLQGQNVQAYTGLNNSAQKWAISQNGDRGYRIQAKCSGFSLDIAGGSIQAGSNIEQYSNNDSDAQRWVFIPYQPSHELTDGRYIIVSSADSTFELDIEGDTYDIEDGCNVQVWHDNTTDFFEDVKSRYNAFDVTYCGNGYYQLVQPVSGKVISVDHGATTNGGNLHMWTNQHGRAQYWAIIPNGNGYCLWAKCSGLVMDINYDSNNTNSNNVTQWQWHGGPNQTWRFVPAEHIVSYNANGGTEAPDNQIKYYKGKLLLSSEKPARTGYTFLGWATNASATTPQYQPGDSYGTDANLTLYAVWKRNGNTITYNANGGENPPVEQFKPAGETVTLSAVIPTRRGYTFLGWATSASATTTQYQPGASYSADADLTLYALWRITNPPTLTGKSVSMLVGDTRDLADLVELRHDGVLDYTLTATAGGVVSVDGQRVTATATGTGALIVSVVEYPAATCTVNIRVVDLGNMLTLPAALSKIEDQAFENTGVTAVTIPAACTEIGNRAFADNAGMVYIFVPADVAQIANDAFDNCPNLTVYCYPDSAAAVLAQARGIRYVLLSDDWVPADALPPGATVTAEKWTYQRSTTETTTSTAGNLEGWTQTGFDWQQTGSGTHVYANYPDGFDTGHPLYSAYAKGALTGSTSGNTKREVSASTVKDYIYWHWTWYWGTSENKLISDQYCIEDGREYNNFKAYENSYIEYVSGQNYVNWDRGGEEDGSCWWFRFDVCQQSYTDYQKLFTYTRTVTTDETSTTPVAPGGTISNVLHWVKYEL